MRETTNSVIEPLLEKISRQFSTLTSRPAGLDTATFIKHYLADTDVDELALRDTDTWCDVAGRHLEHGQSFQSGSPKLQLSQLHKEGLSRTVIQCINDDMPFLVDSMAMELQRRGLPTHLIIHPLFAVTRDPKGQLQSIAQARQGQRIESWIHIETDRIIDETQQKTLLDGLTKVLADVRAAVNDWPAMRTKIAEVTVAIANISAVVPIAEKTEAAAFLAWLADHHFTFLGYREYELVTFDGAEQLNIVPRSGLGILREPALGGPSPSFKELPPALRALARQPRLLILSKASTRATVHRAGYLDFIGIKRFDAMGQVVGEQRFVGLYTSNTYHADPQTIPLLRVKAANVLARAGFPPASHAGKNLAAILQTLPRDELIQINEDDLYQTAMGLLQLGERAKTRLFMRRDVFARFYSCLVYMPRENYNTELRLKLQEMLKRAFNGTSVEFNVELSTSVLARIHLLVRTSPANTTPVDYKALEREVVAAVARWEDGVFVQLANTLGEDIAQAARNEFVLPFPAAYREQVSPAEAVADFAMARTLSSDTPVAVALSSPAAGQLKFRLYSNQSGIALSTSLPMLENMGVIVDSERAYVMPRHQKPPVHLHDFALRVSNPQLDFNGVKQQFEQVFLAVWKGAAENDGFNRLTLAAGLALDDIVTLRAYAKYLRQAGFTFSQSYIEQTLARHPGVTKDLVRLFQLRFDPALEANRLSACAQCVTDIQAALDAVTNADEDRILRRLLAVMEATLRTNAFQTTAKGQRKDYLSFKLESARVPELPEPKPLYEIFVYSARFEGIHLRGGKVARGGLRWSDRPEDFRTEVLGLVKAQMVKNAVIVPVGSKGGFVLKGAPPATEREAHLKYAVHCYQTFLRGLLDLTDNLAAGKIVPPLRVVRHDGDDPYLVVAADKGTAAFSDFANAVSAEYGFWLGDAFASGGSAGYDHKKMGITARGAWESVKRHFREMGINTQTTGFSVVGIGDMSGDVFGNCMLLSPHIRLIAAFDHRHIFLDPSPDSAASFAERKRLFTLSRSSWDDYDKSLLSKGGAVFPRTAKSIPLTNEVKAALAIDPLITTMTPAELMRAVLKAPVDLFYNGGIGTYVKASFQSHGEVGDRANDALRIDAKELRCKVIAEGGNLGLTQLGRIEAAQHGVRLYSDAIDNSAGVDCSDHEVNIKILLTAAIENGALAAAERNTLLAEMTDEVGTLVLKDNYYQTQSLSVSGVRGERILDAQARFIREQEKAGRLNRSVEFLPTEDQIAERRTKKQALTAPERAVLLAYSKMALFDELLKSDLIDDAYVAAALRAYFPVPLRARFAAIIPLHPLKREIIATAIANSTINRTGSVFVHRMMEETGATAAEVVRCFILARDTFGIDTLWTAIDQLDNRVATTAQAEMLIASGRLVLRATLWFLRRRAERMPIGNVLAFFSPGIAAVSAHLSTYLSTEDLAALTQNENALTNAGVPPAVASDVARLDAMYSVLDIVELSHETKRPVELAAQLYFALIGRLNLRWVANQITALLTDTHWQSMARAAMRDDLANLQRQLTKSVLTHSPSLTAAEALIAAWEMHNHKNLQRVRDVLKDLTTARESDLAMLSVLMRELRILT